MAWYENPDRHYPQLPALTPQELDTFLQQPLIARLATHNADGRIHLVPLWFIYADGDILLGTQEVTQKVQNVQRDQQVTVLIDEPNPPFKGVLIYGTASLDYDNVIEKRIRIFSKYAPAEFADTLAHGLANRWNPVIIRVKPQQIISYDYAKD